ncbi:phage tail protein [Neobacillus thermocopriae]|uniref:phage tail protein n=1 Tax=Neobacillus thermocopriae TaxID=1215031 RepID=UPI002E2463E5|nr:phage tail protein [Neobacillus thermocopriae]MED3714367.1 phage tail protein [Neobacillus thermocopriae]
MLTITDLAGNTELLTNIRGLTRKRKVNGEKSLTFFVIPDETNEHSFGMVDTESIVEFDGEEYVIKTVSEKNAGLRSIKEVTTIHKFFCDLMDDQQYDKHEGSITFYDALRFVFDGTGYTFNIIDPFYATELSFGEDNRLALFQKVLEAFGAEFYVVGTQVYLKREIGNKTDFQFRYAHNVKTIDKKIDSTNLATYIRGYGKQNEDGSYVVTAEYTSPNATVLGIRHAPAVRDERYTTYEGLLERLKHDLKDEPDLSITIDFADLRASGYVYEVPNEGDYGFVIYEPMGLDVEARIVEVTEEFDGNLNPIKTAVTLSNLRQGMADIMTRFSNTSKQVERLFNGQETLPYNVLDEAVKLATEAIKSAQTELEFNNGIIAREKTNPNHLVVLNSAGLGVSSDGGQTFGQAITHLGINTDLLTAGQIKTNNIEIVGKDNLFYWNGEHLIAINQADSGKYAKLNSDGLYIAKGAMTIERPDGYKVVNNGVLTHDFSLVYHNPPFRQSGISINGWWWTTTWPNPLNCDALMVKHDARYLKFIFALYTDNASVGARMSVTSYGGTLLGEVVTYNTDPNSGIGKYGETLTIDLGTPTGELIGLYININSGSSGTSAYGRCIGVWKEG